LKVGLSQREWFPRRIFLDFVLDFSHEAVQVDRIFDVLEAIVQQALRR
jgi:hypothetical protein